MLAIANMRGIRDLAPETVPQAQCLVDYLNWGAQNQYYVVEVLPRENGFRVHAEPTQRYVYREGWLHGVLFLKRRRLEVPSVTLDMPEGVLTRTWLSRPGHEESQVLTGSESGSKMCENPLSRSFASHCCQ